MINEKANTIIRHRNNEMKKAAVRHRDSRESCDDCLLTILLSTEFSWFSWAFTSSAFRGWISASESLLSIAAHSSVFRRPSPPSPATMERAVKTDFGIYPKNPSKYSVTTWYSRWKHLMGGGQISVLSQSWIQSAVGTRTLPHGATGRDHGMQEQHYFFFRGGNQLC